MSFEILIVDDHPLFRAALRGAVAAACREGEFIEADSVAGLYDALERHPSLDLLLLDLNLPGAYGFCTLAHLRGVHPQLPVVVVSAMDDPATVRQALAFGAQEFISKSWDAARIGNGVLAVLRGESFREPITAAETSPPGAAQAGAAQPDRAALHFAQRVALLTAQQFRVFGMLCSGRINKQIAFELEITEATVKAHMTAILRKLGAVNRTQAVLLAGKLLVDPQEIKIPPDEGE